MLRRINFGSQRDLKKYFKPPVSDVKSCIFFTQWMVKPEYDFPFHFLPYSLLLKVHFQHSKNFVDFLEQSVERKTLFP
jgi:hypothetical protein